MKLQSLLAQLRVVSPPRRGTTASNIIFLNCIYIHNTCSRYTQKYNTTSILHLILGRYRRIWVNGDQSISMFWWPEYVSPFCVLTRIQFPLKWQEIAASRHVLSHKSTSASVISTVIFIHDLTQKCHIRNVYVCMCVRHVMYTSGRPQTMTMLA